MLLKESEHSPDGDLDFLAPAGDCSPPPGAAAALESVRADLADWIAAAWLARSGRGAARGRVLARARRDVDLLLKQVHAALAAAAWSALEPCARRIEAAEGGTALTHPGLLRDVMAEGLSRFVPPPWGARAAAELLVAKTSGGRATSSSLLSSWPTG